MAQPIDKELFLIETLISDENLYSKCHSIIDYKFFDPAYHNTVKFILEYSDKYNAVPVVDLIEAETGLVLKKRTITKDIFEYSCNEIESFCKREGFRLALFQCVPLVEKDELDTCFELIKESLLISLEKDLGINYLDTVKERLERLAKSQFFQTTGYPDLDDLLGGGLVKGQMIVFSGNSGVGKSITLSNIGLNLMEEGLDVLYVSLELSEDLITLRYDSMIAGHSQVEWKHNIDNTIKIVSKCKDDNYGEMYVKYMDSGANANKVRSYLKEFEIQNGHLPGVLLLDYLDIAGANNNISGDNVSLKDKYVSEEFRNLANEYGMYFLTASQQNRGSIGILEPDQSHIAGGLTKANTSDFWFAIIATDEMKASGIVRYSCIKARSSDGTGKSATLKWTPGTARILNLNSPASKDLMDFRTVDRGKKEEPRSNGGLNSNLMKLIN